MLQLDSSFSKLLWIFYFICLSIIGHFRISLSTSTKTILLDLIGIALNLQFNLERTDNPTILRLEIHEHCMVLYLLSSSLISFISVLWFSSHRSCIHFVRFIPKYLIFWGANVFDSTCSLVVYRKGTDFYKSILCICNLSIIAY